MKRVTLLVLDGFGIGAMEDCKETKPEDIKANTYKSLCRAVGLNIPTLHLLGLEKIADGKGEPIAAYGKNNLAHYGADTYMGHQELMGSKPGKPQERLMKDIAPRLKGELETAGYRVTFPLEGIPVLQVEDSVIIGDNLESQLGNIINVVCDLNRISFKEASRVGKIVRRHVDTSRVIVFGNTTTSTELILATVKEKHPGQWGVDAPKANVYGAGYHVLHLGYGVDASKQLANLVEKEGLPVFRIGKTADVIQAEGYANGVVETEDVLNILEEKHQSLQGDGLFLVNVQETDLAGHKEDSDWYKKVLEEVDLFLERFIPTLGEEDLLFITADHGNDPTIGHSTHTREQTPILLIGKPIKPINIGTRSTLADIAATIAHYLQTTLPEYGTSFLHEVLMEQEKGFPASHKSRRSQVE
ncbi:phosphopentomutase [Sutcliffiella rhizosphaerae]|uniref:Phosphopentomutase n=1 Tax=Sutcliffiella rhizosphaerae TaxID=2880967 RepID=A0ABM8YMD8_9BACI|nr:phosphopentomutase [Sutcliffiella rhizosphaerae]CAG9621168.1 Phosphopentomutase [Sutcliffiella rhizosphaerae]